MIWQYLTEDVKGAASKKEYGKKGERVTILTHSLNMRLVINEKGNKFWVNENQLTSANNQKK
jgi:SH3-like domain-containing protein